MWLGRPSERIVAGDLFRRLLAAHDFIASHHAERLPLAAIARQAGLSPFHFLRLYQRVFAVTPHEQQTIFRLEHARRLLAAGQASVTEVCFQVGYESLGSFSTLFTRRTGRSPVRFQREVRTLVQVPAALARLYIPCSFLAAYGPAPSL
jgi:AraC-like DNA-binding protein